MSAPVVPKFKELRKLTSLGTAAYARYRLAKIRQAFASEPFRLTSCRLAFPVFCRPRTSDIRVFKQIFIDLEYRCLDDCASPDLILDCGANVGYSSAYFLNRFPTARVIAVEPDPDNFKLLCENVKPYGRRCTPMLAAIWPEPKRLRLSQGTMGQGREWGRKVEPTQGGHAGGLEGIDIASLLDQSGFSRIGLLKIDIEGAERHVFGHTARNWIDSVDNIVIELHDDECVERFFQIVDRQQFHTSRCEELTVCKRYAA